MSGKGLYLWVLCLGMAGIVALSLAGVSARQAGGAAVAIDNDDIGGVVTGPRGPEAGVWVIAETRDLPTRLIKSVVTDDQGRYLLPDLPPSSYDVWVRGYGLVDSARVKATPGTVLNLTAVPAPSAKAAAEYYPAQYWLSLLQLPPKSDFPGTGVKGNGISENIRSQGEWIRSIISTDGCTGCHQLGNKATREIPPLVAGDLIVHVDPGIRPVPHGGLGRTWNFTTLLVFPLPPSAWNGARVA